MPVPLSRCAADAAAIARWITALDSERFAVREEATAALEGLAEVAAPALTKVLEGRASLEVRLRVKRLLEGLATWTPERLRLLRVIEVLENVGTAGARQVL